MPRLGYPLWLAVALALCTTAPAGARTIDVGPGLAVPTPAAVQWFALQPGDEVVVHAGTYHDGVIITSHGTAGRPITVRGDGAAILQSSVVLEGASNVVVRGLTIRGAEYPAFVIRHGARDDTVADSTVENSGMGIWIGDGAGGGHRLLNNVLHDNRTHGLAIDVVNAPAGHETLISGNRIYNNVMHGMEINGNRYIIEHNTVWDNGVKLSGTSGIHVVAKDAHQGTGQFNVIRYNTVSREHETDGQDGNGIQLDQWCDNNQIYFNVVFENDGAGIVLFDAANNLVVNNTLYDNMHDSGGHHAYKGDLVIASDFTKNTNHAFGNVVRNNLIYTERAAVVPIYVDGFAAKNTKEVGNNLLYHADPNGGLYFWGGLKGRNIASWNALKPGAPDRTADPMLADLSKPKSDPAGGAGLALRPGSPAAGAGIAIPVSVSQDVEGKALRQVPIGAFAAPSP
jgi:parallel beta-helix repeat protein